MWWSRNWRKFRGNRSCWGSIFVLFPYFVYIAHFIQFTRGIFCFWKNLSYGKIKGGRKYRSLMCCLPQRPTERLRWKNKAKHTHTHKIVFAIGSLSQLQEILVHRHWRQKVLHVLPFVCGFRRRDNLLAWRELFVNLYELKYLVWSWVEYNHFKWIYRVYRFLRFS